MTTQHDTQAMLVWLLSVSSISVIHSSTPVFSHFFVEWDEVFSPAETRVLLGEQARLLDQYIGTHVVSEVAKV